MQTIIIFLDIDGTCANSAARFKKAGPEPKTRGPAYTKWLKKVQNEKLILQDRSIEGMAYLAHVLSDDRHTHLYYLTGRSEVYRKVTREWLDLWGYPPCTLLMRPKGNRMNNGTLKESIIKQHEEVGPTIVVDDDYTKDIQRVCKKNGWTFLKAMSGSYW